MSAKNHSNTLEPADPRLIVQWARRYAKSRTISFLVQWVFIVVMVAVIALTASFTIMANNAGNMVQVYVSAALLMLAIIVLSWFSASSWGADLVFRVTQWLYGQEGYVSYAEELGLDRRQRWLMTALSGGLVIYHLVGALLVIFRLLPFDLLQPYSAAYMVPFLIYMIWVQKLGFWAWFWPVLYGLHAVLLAAGAPVSFPGDLKVLDMVVPVFGYGLLAILIGHLYSRYALYRLRSLARSGLDADAPPEEDGPE